MTICTIDPCKEAILQEYPLLSKQELIESLDAAYFSFQKWRRSSFLERSDKVLNLAKRLLIDKKQIARLMALEMGKPISQGYAEIEKCSRLCEHYAQNAQSYLSPRYISTSNNSYSVYYEPMGVVFGIMPWNFPFWQVFRFAIPTLMAGNTVLFKHAPNTTGCGIYLTKLFQEAGFPKDTIQQLIISTEMASNVIKHDHVTAITLTGSKQAGAAVASTAGSALKKVVLELGGNDPYIVLEDADITLAAKAIVQSRLNNCGQVCIAAKRVITLSNIKSVLLEKIQQEMLKYRYGNPLEENTLLGPMARKDLREELDRQVQSTIQAGGTLITGGNIPDLKGFYYPPTIIDNVTTEMRAFKEELFGPVISVTAVKQEQEAIKLANQSNYGLGASIFTADLDRGKYLARHEIEAGMCFVNSVVSSDPSAPFGGIKQSGFGRELSEEGIREFVNVKTVSIK